MDVRAAIVRSRLAITISNYLVGSARESGPHPGLRRDFPMSGEELRRCDDDDLAVVGFDQLPTAFVDHPMMPSTEQDQVAQVGLAAVHPVDQVMAVAPG